MACHRDSFANSLIFSLAKAETRPRKVLRASFVTSCVAVIPKNWRRAAVDGALITSVSTATVDTKTTITSPE